VHSTISSTESIRGLFANTFNGNFKIKDFDSLDPMHFDKLNVLKVERELVKREDCRNDMILAPGRFELTEVSPESRRQAA
jgi:hypothetical protein